MHKYWSINQQLTTDVNGKLNNIDSLIKTIKYNKLWRCGRLQSSQIYQHQLTIRAPALCTRPSMRLLAPTKSGLRNPTLRVRKTQLACRIENKTATATAQPPNNLPPHLPINHSTNYPSHLPISFSKLLMPMNQTTDCCQVIISAQAIIYNLPEQQLSNNPAHPFMDLHMPNHWLAPITVKCPYLCLLHKHCSSSSAHKSIQMLLKPFSSFPERHIISDLQQCHNKRLEHGLPPTCKGTNSRVYNSPKYFLWSAMKVPRTKHNGTLNSARGLPKNTLQYTARVWL